MRTEPNRTLLPFLLPALLLSALLCARLGYRGAALAGMFVLLFAAAAAALALLFVLILWLISLFVDMGTPQKEVSRFHRAMIVFVMGLCCAFFRARIHVTGADRIPEGDFLLVGNHRSGFDPLSTGWVLRRRRVAFITKPAISRMPIIGPFLHRACFLPIDRENDRAALKTILAAVKYLKDGVTGVAIYPEGTRSKTGELLPFRNGAFKIAQKAKAPVVVAAVRGTEQLVKNFPWRATDVYLDFCAVLDGECAAAMNTGDLGEEVREAIVKSLSKGQSSAK